MRAGPRLLCPISDQVKSGGGDAVSALDWLCSRPEGPALLGNSAILVELFTHKAPLSSQNLTGFALFLASQTSSRRLTKRVRAKRAFFIENTP